jgi:hypothetical protein
MHVQLSRNAAYKERSRRGKAGGQDAASAGPLATAPYRVEGDVLD